MCYVFCREYLMWYKYIEEKLLDILTYYNQYSHLVPEDFIFRLKFHRVTLIHGSPFPEEACKLKIGNQNLFIDVRHL